MIEALDDRWRRIWLEHLTANRKEMRSKDGVTHIKIYVIYVSTSILGPHITVRCWLPCK